MAWIAEQRAQGRTVPELAAELGVAVGAVLRWSNGTVRAMLPVQVLSDERAAVAVVSPQGFCIGGLSLENAIRVLRELG